MIEIELTDLIERLNAYAAQFGPLDPERAMCLEAVEEIERRAWQPISTAPKDKCIWVFDVNRYYESKVRWNGHEWECLDWKGYGTGVGFYPTHWLPLPDLPNKLPRDHGPR